MDNDNEDPRKKKRKEKEDDELALSLSPPGQKQRTQERNSLVVASSSSAPPPPSPSEPMKPKKNLPSQETLNLTLSLSLSPALPQAMALPHAHLSILHTPPPYPLLYCHKIHPPSIGGLPPSHRPHQAAPPPRKKPHQVPPMGKDETVEPPFRWATDRRAVVHQKAYLLSQGIRVITGDVKCKRCEHAFSIAYDLAEKFEEVTKFIELEKDSMHDRAPAEWLTPTFPDCLVCGHENCLKPVIAPKKRAINWLFLLLGGTLGCCTIEQLKYFCKHTRNHRTGAKDRVLYLTYMGICKQLEPGDSLFEVGR